MEPTASVGGGPLSQHRRKSRSIYGGADSLYSRTHLQEERPVAGGPFMTTESNFDTKSVCSFRSVSVVGAAHG